MTSTTLELALMIEGQEGLTWPLWRRLAGAAENGGFHGLFRSDHLTELFGDVSRPVLDTWTSLTWLATGTARIRFGPLVCPLTFYHPAILAKHAAAVDLLSGGRLDLGIGAGWNEAEHRMFGVPFPPVKERMDRLECGARLIRSLWDEEPVTLDQPYYPLVGARAEPRPARGRLPLVIGGRGERRTLRTVAAYADEWNVTRVTFEEYAAKRRVLEGHCRAVGRDPESIGCSLMVPIIVGATPAEVTARRRRACSLFPQLPEDAAGWRTAGFLHGAPEEIRQDLRRWQELGIGRVMLQLVDMEDFAAVDLIAREVLPAFR
jgi:F420-dependent oxidoreductase-like protein